jgi:hypothetical protein
MNGTLCISNDTIFDEVLLEGETVATGNTYATELMPAIEKPGYQRSDEEELHTSFEEAISDRILALHSRLSHLSNPMLDVQYTRRNTEAMLSTRTTSRDTTGKLVQITHHSTDRLEHGSLPTVAWRRATIFACSAMMFLLLGFDCMGFLVLHMH